MILILNCGSSKTPFIEEIIDEYIDYQTVGILDVLDIDFSTFKGVVISGAPLLITEINMEVYLKSIEIVVQSKLPILGICFGHQLLGLHFGAFGAKMKEDRELREIEVIEDSPLFSKLPDIFYMQEDHCESISVAPNFKHLATSDTCVNEAMMHETLPYYGIQFHPEVSGNQGATILENFVRICQSTTCDI